MKKLFLIFFLCYGVTGLAQLACPDGYTPVPTLKYKLNDGTDMQYACVNLSNGGFSISASSVRLANSYSGANAGIKIAKCLGDLPATGGTCDARGLEGNQIISSNIFAGINKPVVLLLGHGKFLDSSCWLIPNDGLAIPNQYPISIIGVGIDASSQGSGKTPISGTIIDNSCSSSPAKFVALGRGVFEMHGVTWMDSSGGNNPFFLFTNTIPKISDNQFFGSKNTTSCDQDVIILGGTTTTIDGTVNAPFQGYGGYVERNFFNHVRRIVYGRTFVNGFPVIDNTVWNQAGSNLAGGAAIEFVGLSDNNIGNLVKDNLIEIVGYPYAIKFTQNGFNNTITGNNFYDPNGTFLAGVRFEGGSAYNNVEVGYQTDVVPSMSEEAGVAGKNQMLTAHQNQNNLMVQPFVFSNGITQTVPSVNAPMYQAQVLTTSDRFFWGVNTAGNTAFGLWLDPLGDHGSAENLLSFRRYDVNQRGIFINAATNAFVEAANDLRLRALGGHNLWLGTNTTGDIVLIGDSLFKLNTGLVFKTDNSFDIGTTGNALRPRNIYFAGDLKPNDKVLISSTAPTIAGAGCGGSSASITNNNGTAAFVINVGTAPTAAGCTVTMPTATGGWTCNVTDITTNSTSVFLQKQISGTTTSVVLANFSDVAVATAPVASDIYRVSCHGY